MKKRIFILMAFVSFNFLKSQTNIVFNGSFETYSACPTGGAEWNVCNGWNNVNMTAGTGAWGTPDYFTACGTGGTNPPATISGTCVPHTGNAMMGLVVYNVPYSDYREYLSTALTESMVPGNTYTLSFWLSNGTGIKSPWTIRNIGVHFSSAPLAQTSWSLINVVPQCEITSNVVSTGWTQYTFTVNPTSNWSYLTIGAFRTDNLNNPTQSFSNPGGPYSVYANYFIDDISLNRQNSLAGLYEGSLSNKKISFFPNPGKDLIYVSIDKTLINKNYTITNNFGQLVSQGILTDEKTKIDIHHLSQGIFIISVEGLTNKARFIKE